MITIKRYQDEDRSVWDRFCQSAKNGLFMFERNFMEYHKHRFTDHSLLFYSDDKLVALLPMNEKDGALFSHAGLTFGGLITGMDMKQHTMNDCFDALVAYAKENGFASILYKAIPHIYHDQPAEEDRYALFRHGAVIAKIEPATVVNLADPLKMPKGRKAQISRAKREGVEIRELTGEKDYHDFMNLENRVLAEHHDGATATHTGEEMYLLYSRFPERIHLYGAFLNGEMIAGSVIYEYRQMIHTTYLAASEIARTIGALDLTISVMMQKYADKRWFDFGISTENGGAYMNEGLIAQKEGFGGRTTAYDTWRIDLR